MDEAITVLDKLKAAERELILRQRVYPGRIATRKMSAEKAMREIALMGAIVADYRAVAIKDGLDLGATGDFPQGKLNQADEGGLKIAIHREGDAIRVDFGKSVAWLGLDSKTAFEMATSLTRFAREIVVEAKGSG